MRRSLIVLVPLSLALSLAVPLAYGGLESARGLTRIPALAFVTLLGMVLLGWTFNAARVRLLAQSLGARISARAAWSTVVSAEFAGSATPAGVGEPTTYLLLLSRHGLPAGRGAALLAVDKFTDLVFFSTAVPTALLLYIMDRGISHPLRMAVLVVALLLAGLIILIWLLRHYRPLVLLLGRILGRFPRLRTTRFRLARSLVQFRHGVRVLLSMGPGRLSLLYLFCVGHWMLRYGSLPVVAWFMGESIPWGYLFIVQAVLLFAGHLSFLPGGGGGIELGFAALLSPYLDPTATASTLLVWRFFTYYWYLLAGAPVFVAATGKNVSQLLAPRIKRADAA